MLVVSMHDESLYAERVIRAGALGYITKQEATRKILVAIRRVLAGSIYLNEKIASQIIGRLTSHAASVSATPAELLTDRELMVFDLTGSGLNTSAIASRMHIARENGRDLPCPYQAKTQPQRRQRIAATGHLLDPHQ